MRYGKTVEYRTGWNNCGSIIERNVQSGIGKRTCNYRSYFGKDENELYKDFAR